MRLCLVLRLLVGRIDSLSVDIQRLPHYATGVFVSNFVPKNVLTIYLDSINSGKFLSKEKYDLSSLALLRSRIFESSLGVANMSEGLENRIDDAIKESLCLNEIYDNAKTKRYTHSRVRRAVLSRQFNIRKSDLNIDAPYCRLLGFNKSCETVFGRLASNCSIPFITRYSDVLKANDDVKLIFEYEDKSTDFYNLVLYKAEICSSEKILTPIKM